MYATGGTWLRFHWHVVHMSCAHILWQVGTATESHFTLKVADPFENKTVTSLKSLTVIKSYSVKTVRYLLKVTFGTLK